jgi:hypothetical protein
MTAASRARSGRRRAPIIIHRRKLPPRLPPLPRPLDAVLIAIDSAKRSGFATYARGVVHRYGEIDTTRARDRDRVIEDAVSVAYRLGVPCGCVLEVPWGGYTSTVIALERTAQSWRSTWVAHGQDESRCIERTAGDWRNVLFGRRSMPREQARMLEGALARQIIERQCGSPEYPPIGPDAAAAICIGQTITRARELLAVLGCRVVDKG